MRYLNLIPLCAVAVIGLSACASSGYATSEEKAVEQLVAAKGPLKQTVDADFEGEAYDQDGEKVICKKTGVTGSRLKQYTVCQSKADWDIAEDYARTKMKRLQQQSGALKGD